MFLVLTTRVKLTPTNFFPRFHDPTLFHHPTSTILRKTKPENQTFFRTHAQYNGTRRSNNDGPPGGNVNNNNGGGDDWEGNNNETKYETPRYNCNPNGYMEMPLDNMDYKTVVSVGSALLKVWTNLCEFCEHISIWTAVLVVAAGCTVAAAAAAVLVFFIFPLL